MGCCLTKENKELAYASTDAKKRRQTLLGIESKLKMASVNSSKVILMELKSASGSGFPSVHSSLHACGPFFEFSLMTTNSENKDITCMLDKQTSRSSYRPKTNEPFWSPPELMQIIVADDNMEILISAKYYNFSNNPDLIGDAVLHAKDVTAEKTEKALKIYNSDTGAHVGVVNLLVQSMTPERAAAYEQQVVFEYQRWVPVKLWGSENPGHLLPTDPGRWSDETGKKWGEFDDVTPKLEDEKDWEVINPWSVLSNPADAEGWTYGSN